LLENVPNEFSTPEKLVEFIRAAHFEDVGICFDLGHAHLMGGVAQAFETVKEHLASAHVHDNSKDRDAHLWPGKEPSIGRGNELVALGRRRPPSGPGNRAEDQKKDISADMAAAYKKLEHL